MITDLQQSQFAGFFVVAVAGLIEGALVSSLAHSLLSGAYTDIFLWKRTYGGLAAAAQIGSREWARTNGVGFVSIVFLCLSFRERDD